jgi:RNA polymerase sigma factor (sigma-70 family)
MPTSVVQYSKRWGRTRRGCQSEARWPTSKSRSRVHPETTEAARPLRPSARGSAGNQPPQLPPQSAPASAPRLPQSSEVLLPLWPRVAFRRVSHASFSPAARSVDRPSSEALFLQHLPRIEKTVGVLSRRHGFRDAEAADLESWIKLRLIEDDYAIFRKFRGESSITTYLTVVIATLVQDYKVHRWGRWRASAAAQRRGKVAVKLETLVYRHGYQLAEAAELLRSRGDTDLGDRQLADLLNELPRRGPSRPREVGDETLDTRPGESTAEEFVEQGAAADERRIVESALRAAVGRMSPEDQCILNMRFWQNMSVADVARALNLPQKPLYKRLDRAFNELRRELTKHGISSERAQIFVSEMQQ